jgi:prepilin-type N-terminal cleavage/methylation domain-containing protein
VLKRLRHRGFVLVEMIVAMFIIAIVALIFFATLPMSTKATTAMANTDQVASIIQHKTDQLRGVGYGRLNSSDLQDAEVVDNSKLTFTTVDGLSTALPSGTGSLAISDFNANVKKVTITILWKTRQKNTGRLSTDVLIAR